MKTIRFCIAMLIVLLFEFEIVFAACNCSNGLDLKKEKLSSLFVIEDKNTQNAVVVCGKIKNQINSSKIIATSISVIDCAQNKALLKLPGSEYDADLSRISKGEDKIQITCWREYAQFEIFFKNSQIEITKYNLPKIYNKKEYSIKGKKLSDFRYLPKDKTNNLWPLNLADLKIVDTKEKQRKYSRTLVFHQDVYEDGSKATFAFTLNGTIGSEIYKRGDYLKQGFDTNKEFDYKDNNNLIGIRIQYFPDCSDKEGYTGENPISVIYGYRNGKTKEIGFYPDGTKEYGPVIGEIKEWTFGP